MHNEQHEKSIFKLKIKENVENVKGRLNIGVEDYLKGLICIIDLNKSIILPKAMKSIEKEEK